MSNFVLGQNIKARDDELGCNSLIAGICLMMLLDNTLVFDYPYFKNPGDLRFTSTYIHKKSKSD